MWRCHITTPPTWIVMGYYGFLPQSKNIQLSDDFKLSIDVDVGVLACLSVLALY